MKSALVLFSLAVVAISNAAVINETPRSRLEEGSIGPGDSRLTTMTSIHTPIDGMTLTKMEIGFSMPTVKLTIAYIKVEDISNSGATAEIFDGGVGSDRLFIRYTPHENKAFHFVCEVYGSYERYDRSGAAPEMVTFEQKHTSPSQ